MPAASTRPLGSPRELHHYAARSHGVWRSHVATILLLEPSGFVVVVSILPVIRLAEGATDPFKWISTFPWREVRLVVLVRSIGRIFSGKPAPGSGQSLYVMLIVSWTVWSAAKKGNAMW